MEAQSSPLQFSSSLVSSVEEPGVFAPRGDATWPILVLSSGSAVEVDFSTCSHVWNVKVQVAASLGTRPHHVNFLAGGRALRSSEATDVIRNIAVIEVVLSSTAPAVWAVDRGNGRISRWDLGSDVGEVVLDALGDPRCVAMGIDGRMLVADAKDSCVYTWSIGSSSRDVVASRIEGQPLARPYCVAVDNRGTMYVAEHSGSRVTRWLPGSNEGEVVAGGHGRGSALNQLSYPTGIAVDGDGALYISEYGNHRVTRWPEGASNGVVVAGGNGAGARLDQLDCPWSVCVGRQGELYISEVNNHRITRWSRDASSGVVVANQLAGPTGMALFDDGSLYVAENHGHRISRWAPGIYGEVYIGEVVAGGAGHGSKLNQLSYPIGVFIF